MDIVDILSDLHKEIDFQLNQVKETYMSGQLKDMEQHKFLQGQLYQLYNMQDFIKSYKKEG
jgi:hypothetical protein|tara:strand:+ start:180 stop:362 length:183 start_codon:yes stop_codon:yes gene_type:complete